MGETLRHLGEAVGIGLGAALVRAALRQKPFRRAEVARLVVLCVATSLVAYGLAGLLPSLPPKVVAAAAAVLAVVGDHLWRGWLEIAEQEGLRGVIELFRAKRKDKP